MKRFNLDNGQGYFKPWATRTSVLLLLLFVTSILIIMAELTCNFVPEHSGWGLHSDDVNITLRRDVTDTRNEEPPVPPARSSSLSASIANPTPTSSQICVQSSGIALPSGCSFAQPPLSNYLSATPDANAPIMLEHQPTGYYNHATRLMARSIERKASGNPICSAVATCFPAIVPTSIFPVSLDARSFPTGNTSPSQITLDPIIVADSGGQTLGYVTTASPAGAISASALITLPNANTYAEHPTQVLTVINGKTYSIFPTPFLTVPNGQHFAEVAAAFPTTSNTIPFESTKTAVTTVSTIVNHTGTYFELSNGQSTISATISLRQYFLVSFLPLILATLYTIPWKILDNTIREMEPFYQLSRPGGATAENSICLDYPTLRIFTAPFKAISRGHMLVFCSSLISLAVMFLPSLASEALFVSMTGACPPVHPNGTCYSAWAVSLNLIRTIQALLFFIAILVIIMIACSFRRTYKIYSEPLSIAGLACLLSISPALETFQRIGSKTTLKDLRRLLAGKRFAILELSEMGQSPCSAIVELPSGSPSTITNRWLPRKKLRSKSPKTPEINFPSDSTGSADEEWVKPKGRLCSVWQDVKTMLHFYLAVLFLSAAFIMIAFYYFTLGDSGFEHWMDSGTFGLRFAWTALGTAIKLFWRNLDQDLRRNEPYHRLLLGSAQPEDSILVPVYMSHFSAILPSLRHRHFHVSLVCFASVLAEFLPICLGSIPYSPSLTHNAYVNCSLLAMTILLFMMACIVVLILRPRKRGKPLPRNTDTLASVCCYIATTPNGDGDAIGMLDKMRGLSKMGTSERNKFVMKSKGLYAMGIVEGGELRIDCDERVTKLWLN